VILTFITLGFLILYSVVLPYFLFSHLISFVSVRTSLFFPSLPPVNCLWFLPTQFQVIPLSVGQVLDIGIITIMTSQISPIIYFGLRYQKFQFPADQITFDEKRNSDELNRNLIRWNLFSSHNSSVVESEKADLWQKVTAKWDKKLSSSIFEQEPGMFEKSANSTAFQYYSFQGTKKMRKISVFFISSITGASQFWYVFVFSVDFADSSPYSPHVCTADLFFVMFSSFSNKEKMNYIQE